MITWRRANIIMGGGIIFSTCESLNCRLRVLSLDRKEEAFEDLRIDYKS